MIFFSHPATHSANCGPSALCMCSAHSPFHSEEADAQSQAAFPVVMEPGRGLQSGTKAASLPPVLQCISPGLQGLGPYQTRPTTQTATSGASCFFLPPSFPRKLPRHSPYSTFHQSKPILLPPPGCLPRIAQFRSLSLSPSVQVCLALPTRQDAISQSDLRPVLIFPVREGNSFTP